MRLNKLLIISLFLNSISGVGQELLSLENAISITLENNYGIQIAKRTVQQAENNSHLLNKGLLPSLTGTASASRNSSSSEMTTSEGVEFEIDDAVNKNYSAGLKVSFTLFDGFQRWYKNKNLDESLALSKLDARQIVESTLIDVYSTYYTANLFDQNVSNQTEILKISKQRLARVKAHASFGQVSQLDVLNAEVDVNNDSISLLNLQNQMTNIKRDLNLLLGRKIDILFVTNLEVAMNNDLKKLDLLNSALDENVQVLKRRQQLRIGQNLDEINKSTWLPKLSFNSTYNWSLQDNSITPTIGNQIQLQEQQNIGLNTGIALNWDIFDGGSNIIRKQNSAIDILNAETNLELVQQELSRDILNAWSNYQNALYLINVQAKNVETNQNNFARTKEKFNLGQINSITFRQAQINLLNAQTIFNKSKFDAKLSELQLLQLSGRLDQVSISK